MSALHEFLGTVVLIALVIGGSLLAAVSAASRWDRHAESAIELTRGER